MGIILLLVFLCISALADYEEDRIPNTLCLIGAATGLWSSWNEQGTVPLTEIGMGCLILIGSLIPLWIIRVVGGGDVKLMLMASCYLGIQVKTLLMLAAACSGVYCFFLLVTRRNLRMRMELFWNYCSSCISQKKVLAYPFDRQCQEDKKSGGIHLSYPVFAGYAIGIMAGLFHGI